MNTQNSIVVVQSHSAVPKNTWVADKEIQTTKSATAKILALPMPPNNATQAMIDLMKNKSVVNQSPTYALNLIAAAMERDRVEFLKFSQEAWRIFDSLKSFQISDEDKFKNPEKFQAAMEFIQAFTNYRNNALVHAEESLKDEKIIFDWIFIAFNQEENPRAKEFLLKIRGDLQSSSLNLIQGLQAMQ